MKRPSAAGSLSLALLLGIVAGGESSLAGDEAPGRDAVVALAEGAVERLGAGGEAALLELGQEIGLGDRIFVGNGSLLSIVPVAGPSAGKVARVRGPFEGTVEEALARASAGGAPVLAGDDVDVLRRPSPSVLEGPGVTRGAAKGPLRPVYPSGAVAAPCGRFVFSVGLTDLAGGGLEILLYDRDPAKGAEPASRVKVQGSPAEVVGGFPALAPKKTYWWKVSAFLDSGEEALSGELAEFTVVPSPLKAGFPPEGFEKPEARASWHMVRFRALREKQLYLDALCELDTLVAAGGGSSVVEQQRAQIAKKLGLDEKDLDALDDLAAAGGGTVDRVKLTDGRELAGRFVGEEGSAVFFQYEGVRYRIERDSIAEILRGSSGGPVMSAAPWTSHASKRYAISTNAGKEFAAEAARHLEATFEAFARFFGEDLGARNARNLKVKIFRDESDYLVYLRKDHAETVKSASGFYAYQDSTLYLYRSFKDGKEQTWPTLFHEASHQILHIVCNQDGDTVKLPGYWVLEALPCFMESLRWNGKVLEPGDPSPDRSANFARLHAAGSLRTAASFVELSQDEFRHADLYDQGHALFWYLLTSQDGKLRPALMKCVKISLQNRSREHAFRKHYGRPAEEVVAGYESWFLQRTGRN